VYKQNKYTRIYYQIIERAQTDPRSISERHHIIPKSLGGTNDHANLVCVSPREHFILHKCLIRMVYDLVHISKMRYALWRMMNKQARTHQRTHRITGREYELHRKMQSQMMVSNNPMHRCDVVAKRTGVKRPDQSAVALRRNVEYWEGRKRPLISHSCEYCRQEFSHIEMRRFCCVRCRARFFNFGRKNNR